MYQSNFISRWQMPLHSALYILLIVSMLWIPSHMDVSASTPSDEVALSNSICEEEDTDAPCVDPDSEMPRCADGMRPRIIGTDIDGEPIWSCKPIPTPTPIHAPSAVGQGGHR